VVKNLSEGTLYTRLGGSVHKINDERAVSKSNFFISDEQYKSYFFINMYQICHGFEFCLGNDAYQQAFLSIFKEINQIKYSDIN
jgi:hypothetical protein